MPYKDTTNRTCGFVEVEEKEKTGKFVRRFLRLDKSKGSLEWFPDIPSDLPNNSQPHGTINVNFITKVDIPAKLKFKARHCFVVNTPMRRYYFQANDETDRQHWVETLINASKIVVSDDDMTERAQGTGSEQSLKSSEEYSYKTEIVAGVVVQKKIVEEASSLPSKGDDSRSLRSVSSLVNNISPLGKQEISPARKIKDGWGVKQGHLRKNWKRRYFTLTTSRFSYYKSDQDKEPIRSMPLSDILTAKVDETDLFSHKDNLFLVATTERIYYIQADSPQDMNDWVKSFHDAIHFSSSLKHKSEESKPGKKMPEEYLATPSGTYVARKLGISPSLAFPAMRNSAHIGKLSISQAHSAVSYRLSSADEALFRSVAPRKLPSGKKARLSQEFHALPSSSEESCGLNSSVDSLSTALSEVGVNNRSPKDRPRSTRRKKVYKRSCSGSEVLTAEVKSPVKPDTDQIKDRHSYPPSDNGLQARTRETNIPASASFSAHQAETAFKDSLSSESFSSPRSVKPSRIFLLDPNVDHRAAFKPSNVKKKRNTGILFSLNNMLNKKVEKMTSAAKKKHGI